MPYAMCVARRDAISTGIASSKARSMLRLASCTRSVVRVAVCIISIIAVKGTAGNGSDSSRWWEMETRRGVLTDKVMLFKFGQGSRVNESRASK